MKVAYLGPENTFSGQAARAFAQSMEAPELIALPSLEAVARSVALQESDFGVIRNCPWETRKAHRGKHG